MVIKTFALRMYFLKAKPEGGAFRGSGQFFIGRFHGMVLPSFNGSVNLSSTLF